MAVKDRAWLAVAARGQRPRQPPTEVTDDIIEMDEAASAFFRQITVLQLFSTAVME